jgi:putative transposase
MPEIYHVLSRGVDKRKIFMDDRDRFRFIHDLYEFNDEAPADHFRYYSPQSADVGRPQIGGKARKLLVNILAFCLMPNHYHLMLVPLIENGVSLFMKKLNGGYVRYFNLKHERTGTLFERKYKSILVENEAHFTHLPYYIHLNVLDLVAPEWRERKLRNPKKALEFLNNYRWSSHLDYAGQKNFPSVTQRDFLLEVFNGEKGYTKSIENWLRELNIEEIGDIILE